MVLGILKLIGRAAKAKVGKNAFNKINALIKKSNKINKPKQNTQSNQAQDSNPSSTKETNPKAKANIKPKKEQQQSQISQETLLKVGALLEENNTSGPEGMTAADQRQEILARQKFRNDSIKVLEKIDEDINEEKQEEEQKERQEEKQSSKSFISKSISGISNTIKNAKAGDTAAIAFLAVKQIWDIMQNLLGDINDAGGFLPWLTMHIGGLWDSLKNMVEKDYGGWGNFILSQLKEEGEFILWAADKIGHFLFGNTWLESMEWWKLNFGLLSEWWDSTGKEFRAWWDYVKDVGITKYILEILKKSIKDISRMILGETTLKSMIEWWDTVQDSGGFLEYFKIKIQRWWEDFIINSGLEKIWGGDKLKKILLGNRSALEVKDARIEQDRLILERKQKREEEEIKNQEELDKKNSNYKEKKANIKKNSDITKMYMYDIYNKNMSDIINKKQTNINTSSNVLKSTKEHNRFTYTGRNSQQWMKIVTSPFGAKESLRGGKGHSGVDFRAKIGTDITAISGGVVDKVYNKPDREGQVVSIKDKKGVRTLYMHLSKIFVKTGDVISKGQLIAKSGNSGMTVEGKPLAPHIHIQVKKNGKNIDPLTYINNLNYGDESASTRIANINNKNIKIKQNINSRQEESNKIDIAAINKLKEDVDSIKSRKITSTLHETIREA